MQAFPTAAHVSVEDYLAGECRSEIRHEYFGGLVYAVPGASSEHNRISLSLASALRSHLRGKPCQVFMADVKAMLRIAYEDIFYYPDAMVTCDPRDTDRYFKRLPSVLIEVLSRETERIDRREKFLSYTRIETLEEYLLVAQDQMEVTIFRRANNWRPEISNQPDPSGRIPSLDFTTSLAAIHEGVFPLS